MTHSPLCRQVRTDPLLLLQESCRLSEPLGINLLLIELWCAFSRVKLCLRPRLTAWLREAQRNLFCRWRRRNGRLRPACSDQGVPLSRCTGTGVGAVQSRSPHAAAMPALRVAHRPLPALSQKDVAMLLLDHLAFSSCNSPEPATRPTQRRYARACRSQRAIYWPSVQQVLRTSGREFCSGIAFLTLGRMSYAFWSATHVYLRRLYYTSTSTNCNQIRTRTVFLHFVFPTLTV